MPANITIRCATSDHTVATVWLGSSLAVHRPIVDGRTSNLPKDWAISHLASGMAACRRFSGSKSAAVALARLWDESFGKIPASGSLNGWPHAAQWLNDLAIAQCGTSQTTGPVNRSPMDELEAATTPAAIQTAVARAMGYEPMNDDEGLQQFEAEPDFIPSPSRVPYNGAIQRKPSGSLWLYWMPQGENYRHRFDDLVGWYQLPLMAEIEEWVVGSTACTPCDDDVEPDHPDSWLSILGLI
jgi:hypothetical protein